MKNFLQDEGDMTTRTIERPPELTEQEVNQRVLSPQTKLTTPYLEPEPENGILGRVGRTMVAFNEWRHQDLFDIIFNDFFFENYGRGFAAASRED